MTQPVMFFTIGTNEQTISTVPISTAQAQPLSSFFFYCVFSIHSAVAVDDEIKRIQHCITASHHVVSTVNDTLATTSISYNSISTKATGAAAIVLFLYFIYQSNYFIGVDNDKGNKICCCIVLYLHYLQMDLLSLMNLACHGPGLKILSFTHE